jgi:hypothetical protein
MRDAYEQKRSLLPEPLSRSRRSAVVGLSSSIELMDMGLPPSSATALYRRSLTPGNRSRLRSPRPASPRPTRSGPASAGSPDRSDAGDSLGAPRAWLRGLFLTAREHLSKLGHRFDLSPLLMMRLEHEPVAVTPPDSLGLYVAARANISIT